MALNRILVGLHKQGFGVGSKIQKNPTPTPSVVRNPTPTPPKNL